MIKFKDYPDTSTPLSAENLNAIGIISIETGVEFDTGNNYNGKTLYGKEVDCGFLNTGVQTIATGISNVALVHYIGSFKNTDIGTVFSIPRSYPIDPSQYNVDADISLSGGEAYINITAGTNFNGTTFRAYVTVFYTKN